MAGSAADRKRTRQAKAAAPSRSRRRSPKDAGAGSGRQGGGRSRARIGASCCTAGFHETSHGGDEGLFGAWRNRRTGEGRGNRPVAPAGRETAKGFGSEPRPERGSSKRLRPRRRAPGERQGLRAATRSERGFRAASRLARFLEGRDGFGPASFERGDPRSFGFDASLGRRHGFGRAGSTKGSDGRTSVLRERPDGDRRGAFGPPRRDPPGPERGFAASLRDPGKAAGASEPRRNPEAAQREMASPPSDGSQGWDKWGPVATLAPIIDSGLPFVRAGASRFSSSLAAGPFF